jgi:RNA polymerase sigma-70 factor (ECF subfamily)
MTDARADVVAAVGEAHRRAWARVVAATVRITRDFELAEECVQEAYAAALESWGRTGLPDNPGAWLTTAARRRAVDAIRRDAVLRSKLPLLAGMEDAAVWDPASDWDSALGPGPGPGSGSEPAVGADARETMRRRVEALGDAVPDERLRLIFTCCHPALAQEGQVALTLRLVCGVATADIARLLLVSEPTVAARITRAKKKIATARIPYRIPAPADLPERLRAALAVIYLIFTAGHTAPSGSALVRGKLADQALGLARMLRDLMPGEPEVRGLYALVLVTDARRVTRLDAEGRLVQLKDQDRSRWDRAALTEAHEIIVDCLRSAPPGRYVLQAAIASLYAAAPAYDRTDWPQIVTLYDLLLEIWPSPVVALNRAVALSMTAGPQAALAEVERLEHDAQLSAYRYLHAVKADILHQLDRQAEAADAYRRALAAAGNQAEQAFLAAQLRRVDDRSTSR